MRRLLDSVNPGLILVCAVVGFLGWYLLVRKKPRLPPGPRPYPFIGNLPQLWSQKNFHEYLLQLTKEYGPIYTLHMGTTPTVIVNNITVANEMLVKKIDQFADRPTTYGMGEITEGKRDIFSQDYSDFVKFHRKVVRVTLRNSMMNDSNLEKMTHLAITKASRVLDKYAETKEKFCPKELVVLTIYSCFAQLNLNRNFDFDDPDLKFISSVFKNVNEYTGQGFFIDHAPWLFKHLPRFGNFKAATDLIGELAKLCQKFIDDHRKDYNEGSLRPDVIDHLTKALDDEKSDQNHKKFDEKYFRQSVLEVFSGGADSNISTLYWTLMWLTNNPDVQDKMAEEIHENIGRDRLPSVEDKVRLQYCEAAMFEGMRVAPAVPLNIRSPKQDATLAGYDIPKGTPITVNHYALHFDEEEWDEPEKFKPERFMNDDGTMLGKKPRSFLPFSAGRRVCIGEGVAKIQLFCIMTGLMQNYKLLIPDGQSKVECESSGGLVVTAGDFYIQVEKRK